MSKNYANEALENGSVYGAVLDKVYVGVDYITDTPTLNMSYLVYITPWQTTEVVNSYKIYGYAKYRRKTVSRIFKEMESKYKFSFNLNDSVNEITLSNAFQNLVGTKVEIQPFNYKGIQKYRIIATEMTQDLDSFKKLKKEYRAVFGNKTLWRKKQLKIWYGDDVPKVPDEIFEKYLESLDY